MVGTGMLLLLLLLLSSLLLKCTYLGLSDTVTLNVAGALYTVNGIMENSAVD